MGGISRLRVGYVVPTIALIAAGVLPYALGPYLLHIAIYTLWIIYLCVTWNILASCGQRSLCHPLFVGSGAYTSTLIFLHLGISPWIGMWPGVFVAIFIALGVGFLCFTSRQPPLTFALITLALNFIGVFAVSTQGFLGRNDGLRIPWSAASPKDFLFLSKLPYYYIILAMVIGALAVYRLIERSTLGLRLKAIRDNERAAAAVGVDVARHKFIALLMSAGLSAVGGTFWAQYTAFISPDNILSVTLSILLVLFVMVGGVATLWGPVIAAAVLVPLGEILRGQLGSQVPGMNLIVYGVIIVASLILMPAGIMGRLRDQRMRFVQSKRIARQ